ncbi:MAG: hypothetical protein Q9162_003698 [Coniocarpon cinnabarinum]
MVIAVASVGDIIAVAQLAKELIDALKDAQGSSHDFHQLVQHLQSLTDVLKHVDDVTKRHDVSPSLDALRVSISRTASNCEELVEQFFGKIRKYQRSLKPGRSGALLQDAAKKMRWKFFEAGDVERFRTEILAHAVSMQTMLEVWYITVNEISHAETRGPIDKSNARKPSTNGTHTHQSISRPDKSYSDTLGQRPQRFLGDMATRLWIRADA